MQGLDEHVDVVPAPVTDVLEPLAVRLERGAVGERLAGQRIGVEVVVQVHAVDVVAVHDVQDDLRGQVAYLRQARVEPQRAAVAVYPVRVQPRLAARGELLAVGLRAGAVGIEPGVEFQPAFVRLGDEEGQRVIAGVAALVAGEVLRPGLVRGAVERVGRGTDLDVDGVEVQLLGHVEQVAVLRLLLGGRKTLLVRPVAVVDRRDPHRTGAAARVVVRGALAAFGRRETRRRRGRRVRPARASSGSGGDRQRRGRRDECRAIPSSPRPPHEMAFCRRGRARIRVSEQQQALSQGGAA